MTRAFCFCGHPRRAHNDQSGYCDSCLLFWDDEYADELADPRHDYEQSN